MLKDDETRKKELGKRLRMYRMASKLTQKDVAKILGVNFSTVAMWETGQRVPSALRFEELLELYDVRLTMSYK